jgi:O-antigen/teichoic acid export membrane protein
MLERLVRGKTLLLRSTLIKNSSAIFISSTIAGLFSYGYSVYIARHLGPEAFGTVGALLSIYTLIAVALGPLTSTFTKFVAIYNAEARPDKIAGLLFFGLSRALLLGGLFVLTFLIFSRAIAGFLRVSSPLPVMILGLLCLAAVLSTVVHGVLRGLQAFWFLGSVAVVEAILRLASGLGLVVIFWVNGALLAYGLATLIAAGLCFIPLRPFLRQARAEVDLSGLLSFSAEVVLITLCYAAINNLPIIFCKRYNTPAEAGLLVAVVSLGNLVVPLTDSFAIAMFPLAAELHARGESAFSALTRAMFFVALISLGAVFGFWVLGNPLIMLTYGVQYAQSITILPVYAVARALLAVAGLYTIYCLSTDYRRGALILLLPTVVQLLLLLLYHRTFLDILKVQVAGGLLILAVFAADRLLYLVQRSFAR